MSSLATFARQKMIKRLMDRDGGNCHYCGVLLEENDTTTFNPNGVSVDHIIPQIDGGSNADLNLVLACRRCNGQKKTKHYQEFHFAKHTDLIITFMMDGDQ